MKKLRNYIQWLRLKHAIKKANKFHNLTGYKYFMHDEDRPHQGERQCQKMHKGHEEQDPKCHFERNYGKKFCLLSPDYCIPFFRIFAR